MRYTYYKCVQRDLKDNTLADLLIIWWVGNGGLD